MGQVIKGNTLTEGIAQRRKLYIGNIDAYNMFTDAGTFNGVTCTTSAITALFDRRYFRAFSSANNANDVAQTNFLIPEEYVKGRDILVRIYYTYNDAVGGNIQRQCGLSKAGVLTSFGGDLYTYYQSRTITVPANAVYNAALYVDFIFDGATLDLDYGDKISVIIFRDTRTGNPDTLTSTVYVSHVSVMSL